VDGFARVARAHTLPSVAIGGVTAADVGPLVQAGAVGVAVIMAVLGAADPEAATRALRMELDRTLP
jgi:thiamine-phosphate pyrophosphorylase